ASDEDGDSEVAAADDETALTSREPMEEESVDDEPIEAVRGEATFELERPRGFLAPVVDTESEAEEARSSVSDDDAPFVGSEADVEPVVAIPRPAEGPRQQSLFLSTLDDALVREAIDIIESSRRASAALLQRKLRIDHDQAKELLALLAHRGLLELAADGTQGRVLG
ncbi:MAG: DNA translocase FtsK, partial [Planctomycetota bacterium]